MAIRGQAYRLDWLGDAKTLAEANTRLSKLWIKTDEMIQTLFKRLKADEDTIALLEEEIAALNSLGSQLTQVRNQVVLQDPPDQSSTWNDAMFQLPNTINLPFTQGSVIFAGPSGKLAQNNANLFWDDTNTRFGVGTNTPTAVTNSVVLSLGSNTTLNKLGAIIGRRFNPSANSIVSFYRADSDAGNIGRIAFLTEVADATAGVVTLSTAGTGNVLAERVRIDSLGRVGIGTTSPQTLLNIVSGSLQVGLNTDPFYSSFSANGLGFHRNNSSFIDQNVVAGSINIRTSNATPVDTDALSIISSGYVGIGTTAPTAVLHLKAGAASANAAPLKFTSGTNLTTAEAGAIEYNGTNLFFTRSGTTREGVLTQSAVTTEVLVSDTSVTVNINGTTYKLLARA